MTRDECFTAALARLGRQLEPSLQAGGNYVTAKREGNTVYVAGQIPKDIKGIAIAGRVGADVDLVAARDAAALCALRALAAAKEVAGSLDAIASVLRLNVFIQCADNFTQHSEVADGASDILVDILGGISRSPRTSVGVYSLPKNVPVELDVTLAIK